MTLAEKNAGHVRIYDWDGNSWVQQDADIEGEAAHDTSGWSVSLSTDGQTLAIGGFGTMAMVLMLVMFESFGWDGNAWVQQGIDIDGEAEGDWLGYSVSLSGDGTTLCGQCWKMTEALIVPPTPPMQVMSGSSVELAVIGYSKVQP